jgi:hypothetical protein
VDLGEGFLVQDDLNALGDVDADLNQHGAGVGGEGFVESRTGDDALSDDGFDLGKSVNCHG